MLSVHQAAKWFYNPSLYVSNIFVYFMSSSSQIVDVVGRVRNDRHDGFVHFRSFVHLSQETRSVSDGWIQSHSSNHESLFFFFFAASHQPSFEILYQAEVDDGRAAATDQGEAQSHQLEPLQHVRPSTS